MKVIEKESDGKPIKIAPAIDDKIEATINSEDYNDLGFGINLTLRKTIIERKYIFGKIFYSYYIEKGYFWITIFGIGICFKNLKYHEKSRRRSLTIKNFEIRFKRDRGIVRLGETIVIPKKYNVEKINYSVIDID